MRSLVTILMTAIGGTIGYLLTDDPFMALVGGAVGIVADLYLEYKTMKTIKKTAQAEPRQQ